MDAHFSHHRRHRGLIVADPHVMPYFRSHARTFDDVNDYFDTATTTAEVIALPAALMIAGYKRHDQIRSVRLC